jgi:hypothetical protein
MAEKEAPKAATPPPSPPKPVPPENRLTILENRPKEWLPGKPGSSDGDT